MVRMRRPGEWEGERDSGWEPRGKWRRALTLAEMPEEHIKEGDVDRLVGSSVVFNLAQHHLQPEHRAGREHRNMHGEGIKRRQNTQPLPH